VLEEINDLIANGRLIEAFSAAHLALGQVEFGREIKKATDDKGRPEPEIAKAIATLKPKLRAVLTTNLDRFLERAFGDWEPRTDPTADLAQDRNYILKLNGTRSNQDTWGFSSGNDSRGTIASPTHQRTLEALFQTCPILFVGCDLEDDDFVWLRKVRTLSDHQPPTHYALLPRTVHDRPYLRSQLQEAGLRLVPHGDAAGDHAGVIEILHHIASPPTVGIVVGTGQASGMRSRVLIAGPYFGLSPDAVTRVQRLWAEGLTDAHRSNIDAEFQTVDVVQVQIGAIVSHDVVIDVSPWRAFARWRSDGLRELERTGQDAGDAPRVLFAFPDQGTPTSAKEIPEAALERLRERWPMVQACVGGPLVSMALGGLEAAPVWCQALAALCPDAELVVDGDVATVQGKRLRRVARHDADAADLTAREYLRALRVVAGQVTLAGEVAPRALHDVWIEVEISPLGQREGEQTGRLRKTQGEAAEASSADDLAAEIEAREQAARPVATGTVLSAGAVASLAERVFLWGQAGTGKSTLLQWLACKTARAVQAAESAKLPVWIPRLDGSSRQESLQDLASRVVTLALGALHFPIDRRSSLFRMLQERITSGEAHLFIDSLDEAPDTARATLARLPPTLQLHVASRMTEPIRGRFTELELKGLTPLCSGSFLRHYFGAASWIDSLLRELRDLPDGPRWARTPVLLSLAAAYYQRKKRLAGSTLDLYAEVIGVTEDTDDRGLDRPLDRAVRGGSIAREEAVEELSRLARRMLVPDNGEATVTFAESELQHSIRGALRLSGLFTGTDRLRFAHLSFGEYFAARAELDLRAHRKRWLSTERLGREEGLDLLPMAHAFQGVTALQALLQDAEMRDTPDHRMLRLLLRSLRYGGDGVTAFCEQRAARVLGEVLARMQMPSGRFGHAERRLLDAAEPTLMVLTPFLKSGLGGPAEHHELLEPLLEVTGEVGTEAHVIAWALGLRAPCRRTSRWWDTVRRVARALLRSGLGVREMVELTKSSQTHQRYQAVEVLGRFEAYWPSLRMLLCDESVFVRMRVIQMLAGDGQARPLLRERLWDDESHPRRGAIYALRADPGTADVMATWLNERHPFVQSAAICHLALHPERWDELRRFISLDHLDVARDAIRILAQDPCSRGAIRELLDQSLSRRVRWPLIYDAAVRALLDDAESASLISAALAWPDASLGATTLKECARREAWRDAVLRLAEEGVPYAIEALAAAAEHRPIFRRLLKHPSEWTRVAAIEALSSDPTSLDLIREHLEDPAYNVCVAAIGVLAKDPPSRQLLQEFFTNKKDEPFSPGRDFQGLRAQIVRALAEDEEARPMLMNALTDHSYEVRREAVSALANVPSARADIRRLLGDERSMVWDEVVKALADEPQIREMLGALLLDDLWAVLIAAFHLLVNEEAPRRDLQDLVRRGSWARFAALEPLSRDPASRPLLHSIFDDLMAHELPTYFAVLEGDPTLKRVVREKLRDRRVVTELRIYQSLNRYVAVLADDPTSKPLLRSLFQEEDELVAAAVASAMAGEPDAKPKLVELLSSKHPAVRARAVEALAGDADVVPTLRSMMGRDEEEGVRTAAVTALAHDPGSRVTLRDLLADRQKRVRTAAFRALADSPEEQLRLWERLAQEDEDELRAEIAEFLAAEPASSPEARERMRSCLGDPFSRVRIAATKALSPFPAPPGMPVAQVRSLRLALHLHGLRKERLSVEDYALQSRLDDFVRNPEPFVLEDHPDLAEAVLGWLCVRLAWASPDGSLDRGRIFGEVKDAPMSLLTTAAPLLVRVAMDASVLPRERWLHPTHNLIEVWQVAKMLRARTPPAIVLACADVEFDDLVCPDLAPGQVSCGPTYFGFRVALPS